MSDTTIELLEKAKSRIPVGVHMDYDVSRALIDKVIEYLGANAPARSVRISRLDRARRRELEQAAIEATRNPDLPVVVTTASGKTRKRRRTKVEMMEARKAIMEIQQSSTMNPHRSLFDTIQGEEEVAVEVEPFSEEELAAQWPTLAERLQSPEALAAQRALAAVNASRLARGTPPVEPPEVQRTKPPTPLSVEGELCELCDGTGVLNLVTFNNSAETMPCDACGGSGRLHNA